MQKSTDEQIKQREDNTGNQPQNVAAYGTRSEAHYTRDPGRTREGGETAAEKSALAKKNDEKLTRYIEKQQRELCGERYIGFCLARLELDPEHLNLISKWVNNPINFLVWMGAPGTGKTSFAAAMIDYMIRNSYPWADKPKFKSYRYWREYEFFEKVKSSFDLKGDAITTIKYLIDDDVVYYDDMKIPTDWRRDQVVAMVDIRYCSMLPTIVTTNFTKNEIYSIYGDPTGDRLFAKENIIIDTHGQRSRRQE